MRRPSPLASLATVAIVGGFALSGCFTTSADFKADAEKYITTAVADALEVEFSDATCEEPPTQEVGTTFTCTATDIDGQHWEFENTIDGKNEYSVVVTRQPTDP